MSKDTTKLSLALKRKWESGTRKPNPPETYIKSSASLRKTMAERGGNWIIRTFDSCSKGGKTVTEKKINKNREIAAKKLGKRNPPGPSERGVNNWKAKFWILISPDKSVISGVNLKEIIRRHEHLFDPLDVAWEGRCQSTCKASKGLQNLFHLRKGRRGQLYAPGSWKGWMAAESADMIKNVDFSSHEVMLKPRIPAEAV